MDKSGDRNGITTVIELDQTPWRNVRRKLVQSTLMPHKSDDVIEPYKEEGEDQDGELCNSSQGKKKRKQKEKTPKNNGASKKLAKGKSPRKSTPKKTTDQTIAASPPVPNLRLEAKLRAEEDSRRSAGKQLHPFFSSWKGGKKNQEPSAEVAVENGRCHQSQGRDKSVTIGPIHVFERCQESYETIDWKNWSFCEQTSTTTWSLDQQLKLNSLEHRPKDFDLNELPTLSHPDVCVINDKESDKCAHKEDKDGAEAVDCEVHEVVNLSDYGGAAADISHEPQSISSRESESRCQPRNTLWVDKYQPKCASEVCGNTESVKLLNEWLCEWHERRFQPSKEFLSSDDEEKSQDADYGCSDSENIGAEDCLKNVLLIVGPVGSGKSAAVHACAKEQGFKILESNASECRSGTVVRHKFGEALKSYSLSRSLDTLFDSCVDGNGVEDVIEVSPVLFSQNDKTNLKPLILFEDVNICFAEDRGLVSAIQKIAEQAKGPVVLTANDKNHGLPDNLERIEICFSMPSTEELSSHLALVCVAEEVKVNPSSLKQLTISSGGDIRKAIMQLQFWFQSKSKKARKAKNTGDPDLFDYEAGHELLPKIIARDFPSQLSQYVESEIAKSLSMAEESYNNAVEVFIEEVENEQILNRLFKRGTRKNSSIEVKKAAMLRQNNACFEDFEALKDILSIPFDLSNTSHQPKRRKLNVVMSSDSEDEQPMSNIGVEENCMLSSCCRNMEKETIQVVDKLETSCQYETSKLSCVNEVSQSVDVSCVPESSYVVETLMDDEADLSPRAISCGHFDGRVEASTSEDIEHNSSSPKEIYIERLPSFDCLKNTTCEFIAESCDGTMMEEYIGNSQKLQPVTDECSRIDFGMALKTAQKPKLDAEARHPVQESWKKLRSGDSDLKPYLDSEPVEAPQVLDMTHQITNLISEADLTHARCLNFGALEPMMNASGDVDTSGLSQVLEQMTSVVAQQGFSFFTNQIATTSNGSCCIDMKQETPGDLSDRTARLCDILESLVPLRSLKGRAFHEYASFIGQISRADPSNLPVATEKTRRRRSREARHYLSIDLSSEDIAFLGQHSTYRGKDQ